MKLKLLFSKYSKIVLLIIILSLTVRYLFLSFPDWQIFDEIYYYNFAKDYISHINFFDVHPPLGKLFISLGLMIFDDSLFGARFFQVIAGTGVIYLIYQITRLNSKNIFIAVMLMFLAFFETSLYVESRYALLNIFILFFNLLSVYCFCLFIKKYSFNYLVYTFLFLSLSTCVKWTGLFNIGVYALFILFDDTYRKYIYTLFTKKYFYRFFILLIVLIVPYILILFFDYYKEIKFISWHDQSYNFHKNLVSNHPYASSWYTWFLDLRPIWLEFRSLIDGNLVGIIEVGNPFIVITGSLSILFNLYLFFVKKIRNNYIVLYLLLVLVNTLPWVFIKREAFYYHYLVILPFVLLNIGYTFFYLYKYPVSKYILYLLVLLSFGFFVWFWPLLNGTPIYYESYNLRILIPSWR